MDRRGPGLACRRRRRLRKEKRGRGRGEEGSAGLALPSPSSSGGRIPLCDWTAREAQAVYIPPSPISQSRKCGRATEAMDWMGEQRRGHGQPSPIVWHSNPVTVSQMISLRHQLHLLFAKFHWGLFETKFFSEVPITLKEILLFYSIK